MIRKLVKCFKGYAQFENGHGIEVYYTVPDFYYTLLFSCIECGTLFCADEEDMNYNPKLFAEIVASKNCPECAAALQDTLKPYPATFRLEDGSAGTFEPSREIPDDSEASSVECLDLYT